ncbi:MAG: hypothetical protein EXR72_25690 [Myxococcales bacterium]|nr:hypothetical protein [Myxococcales bacterium]
MRHLLRALLVAAPLAGACNTPSVPLPPPELSALSFAAAPAANMVELRGKPSARHLSVRFSAFNDRRKVGVLVDTAADGSFNTEPFSGSSGDLVELSYESAGKRSEVSRCELTLDVALNNIICH